MEISAALPILLSDTEVDRHVSIDSDVVDVCRQHYMIDFNHYT